MRITLAKKEIEIRGKKHELNIGVIIGWHKPNISLKTPVITINNTPFTALLYLMKAYVEKDTKVDDLESVLEENKNMHKR